jgi:hypothetical protein
VETPSDESGDQPTTLVTRLGAPGSNHNASRADNKKATRVDSDGQWDGSFEAALIDGLEDEREQEQEEQNRENGSVVSSDDDDSVVLASRPVALRLRPVRCGRSRFTFLIVFISINISIIRIDNHNTNFRGLCSFSELFVLTIYHFNARNPILFFVLPVPPNSVPVSSKIGSWRPCSFFSSYQPVF